jgi:TPR repeat protein
MTFFNFLQITVFLYLSVFLASLSLGQDFLPGLEDPSDFFSESKKFEADTWKMHSEAKELYIIQGMKKDREEAVEIWRRIALIQPRENAPKLNYAISQAALNSGEFEAAKRAFVALGELLPDSLGFRAEDLESVVWQSPEASYAVRIVDFSSENRFRGKGSGVVISPDGWILTAAHVVANLERPGVHFPDGSAIEITHIHPGTFKADLALVKVDRRVPQPPTVASDSLAPGEPIYSLGFPSSCLVPVRSKGIFRKTFHIQGQNQYQTTLSVLPGSSGSGVFNQKGELTGVAYLGLKKESLTDKNGTCWVVPLADIKDLLTAWKTSPPFPVHEKEDWKDKSVFWCRRETKEYDEALALFDSNPRKAISLLEEAYEDGTIQAGYLLGILYCNLPQATSSEQEAGFRYFDKSSEAMPASLTFRGLLKLRGIGTKTDPKGGIEDLEQASIRGSALANAHLAGIYFQGKELKADHQKAMVFAEKAAESGEPIGITIKLFGLMADLFAFDKSAPMLTGDSVRNSSLNPSKEALRSEKAIHFFEYCQIASKQDAPLANYLLGMCYLHGVGTNAEPSKAVTQLELSAQKGDVCGSEALGGIYFVGKDNVPRDLEKSKYWSEKAADKGSVKMKVLYASSEVMLNSKDPSASISPKALKYLNEACDANLPSAQELLGIIYLEGKLTPKDLKKSVDLLEKAIKNGSTGASAYLPLAKVELEAQQKSSK